MSVPTDGYTPYEVELFVSISDSSFGDNLQFRARFGQEQQVATMSIEDYDGLADAVATAVQDYIETLHPTSTPAPVAKLYHGRRQP